VETIIGFSPHRVEVLPFAEKHMQGSDLILLEEPADPYFPKFLEGSLSADEYLSKKDFWFPGFAKESLKLLKCLYSSGCQILQVEPYFEALSIIQNAITRGDDLAEVLKRKDYREVYEAENLATGKLLAYYKATLEEDFEAIIGKVIEFSKADAERFRLRDRLRAEAIKKILEKNRAEKVYIEAGTIHIYFKKLLHIFLKNTCQVKHAFLLEPVVKALTGKPWIFPPGELLTLRFILKRKRNPEVEKLLAARSLIYIKIIPKEEFFPTQEEPYPHLKAELKAISLVNKLSFEDCRKLYKKLFFIKSWQDALKEVEKLVL